MITSILFDLDGVLCDCTELHYQSLNKALQSVCGFIIDREEHNSIFNGLPTKRKLEILSSDGKIKESDKEKIWHLKQDFTKETILELLRYDPTKIELHQWLHSKNIQIACITNSILETATLMLKTTGQLDSIDWLIANDMIRHPKPHPEGYIRGMIHFGSMPENTLIVEDSPVGLQAANATGANVWAVSGCTEVSLSNLLKLPYFSGCQ
jgi:beta-phosphoglucomutase